MWLKITFNDEDLLTWSTNSTNIKVDIIESKVAPVNSNNGSFRLSPIYGLSDAKSINDLKNTTIHYFNFSNAYRILGKIDNAGSQELKDSIFFSLGLSSIIMISSAPSIMEEFREIVQINENAYEKWIVKDQKILSISYKINNDNSTNPSNGDFDFVEYKDLHLTDRSIIDEFIITIRLLLPKLIDHMPAEELKMRRLIEEVNGFVNELLFLNDPKGNVPSSLNEYTLDELRDSKLNQILRNQNLDRIIQINSSLSYISTQAFSGAIPILERRSLIRRNSLLGVGSGILALNNIAKFIENAFSKVSFENIILKYMSVASPLEGLDTIVQYDSRNWNKGSINNFPNEGSGETPYYKLPYFSGRLGFRETEYSIAAALQSVSQGGSLEWSLMTLTHEMLHGHVRNIITSLFYKTDGINPDQLRNLFYECFKKRLSKNPADEKLDDSIRNIILAYCSYTFSHGSLTVKKNYSGKPFVIPDLPQNQIWNIFESEFRNISEIFVHILDLHYFYAGRVSIYIPLIWSSWIAIPHINGDIRQYVLRSLLAIASKEDGDVYTRFKASISRFSDILKKYEKEKLNFPIIPEIISTLDDKERANDLYFTAFKASLIIVDLVTSVFISEEIRSTLFRDEFVSWETDETDEDGFEEKFIYNLPLGFNDEVIESPLSFLLDRMTKVLNSEVSIPEVEKDTTVLFLALNSNS